MSLEINALCVEERLSLFLSESFSFSLSLSLSLSLSMFLSFSMHFLYLSLSLSLSLLPSLPFPSLSFPLSPSPLPFPSTFFLTRIWLCAIQLLQSLCWAWHGSVVVPSWREEITPIIGLSWYGTLFILHPSFLFRLSGRHLSILVQLSTRLKRLVNLQNNQSETEKSSALYNSLLTCFSSPQRLGIPDSHIIMMISDDVACDPRNPEPGIVRKNLYSPIFTSICHHHPSSIIHHSSFIIH